MFIVLPPCLPRWTATRLGGMQQQEIPGALSSCLRVPPAGVVQSTLHRNPAGENNDGATDPRDEISAESR